MITQKYALELYIDFLQKTLGKRKGYTEAQRQEIILDFLALGCQDLDRLSNNLQELLINGERVENFSRDDIKAMLSVNSEPVNQATVEKFYQNLRQALINIPPELNEQIFIVTEVMTRFKNRYPEVVNAENFGWTFKRILRSLLGRL